MKRMNEDQIEKEKKEGRLNGSRGRTRNHDWMEYCDHPKERGKSFKTQKATYKAMIRCCKSNHGWQGWRDVEKYSARMILLYKLDLAYFSFLSCSMDLISLTYFSYSFSALCIILLTLKRAGVMFIQTSTLEFICKHRRYNLLCILMNIFI